MNVIFLHLSDDWVGVYFDGTLVLEGHQISPYYLIEKLWEYNKRVDSYELIDENQVNQEWAESMGHCPVEFDSVVLA